MASHIGQDRGARGQSCRCPRLLVGIGGGGSGDVRRALDPCNRRYFAPRFTLDHKRQIKARSYFTRTKARNNALMHTDPCSEVTLTDLIGL